MNKKRVLFIGIGFYDYEQSIIDEFVGLGYDLDYFSEVPVQSLTYKYYLRRNNLEKLKTIGAKHCNNIVKKCGRNYDLVFIIKCENFTTDALEWLRAKNTKAKFILYLWDSLTRFKETKNKFRFFDSIYSFDRYDCENNKHLIFHPLFYRNEYFHTSGNNATYKYGLYHLGWYHSDRLKVIKSLVSQLKANSISFKIVLFAGYVSYVRDIIFGGPLKDNKELLIFKPIPAKENLANILQSKIVLDIAHPDQSGLTMRVIEAIGTEKKIITTNKDIVHYDFYNPENISIIDREAPIIDAEFFMSDYKPLSKSIKQKYALKNWLKTMIEKTEDHCLYANNMRIK
jgi:hypothetical protein